MKIFTLQFCCTKKPIRYALNATNKTFFFFFFWASLHAIFSSAFWLPYTFLLETPRNSLLDKCTRGPRASPT